MLLFGVFSSLPFQDDSGDLQRNLCKPRTLMTAKAANTSNQKHQAYKNERRRKHCREKMTKVTCESTMQH